MNKTNTRFSVPAPKRSFTRFAAVFFALALVPLCFSCLAPSPAGQEEFFFIKKNERIAHANAVNYAELSFELVDASASGAARTRLRELLYKGKSAEAYLRDTSSAWRKAYAAAKNASGGSAEWFYEEAHSLARAGTFAVIKRNTNTFRGGARPEWREDSFVFDLAAPARLSLGDIVTAEGMQTLASLTGRELRRFSQTKTGGVLPEGTPLSRGIYFEDAIAPSPDFYPAENGLNFQWDAAEIAPFSEGAVEVSLRWSEVSALLTPRGKALAGAFQPLK